MHNRIAQTTDLLRKLRNDRSGLAVVEFAIGLPFFMGLTVAGIETANYAATVMQLNQITIHSADTAARMGEGTGVNGAAVTEATINDVFEGAKREGESLDLDGHHAFTDPGTGVDSVRGNAKMWLSSLEPVDPATTPATYRLRWQRCTGAANFYTPTYGTPTTVQSVTSFGPAGNQIVAPPGGAVMFVETKYYYKPLIFGDMNKVKEQTLTFHAAMVVRERRDLNAGTNGVRAVTGVTASTCS